jgi:nucleotide-binding universal stress UspA family protein
MTFSTVLVHVDATPHSDARVQLATNLAKRYSARLCGLYVVEDPVEVVLPVDANFNGVATRARARAESKEEQREACFKGCLLRAQIEGDWHQAHGETAVLLPHWARRADLAIVGQGDPDDALDAAAVTATYTLLESGRPILVVPYAGHLETIGTNIVIAWKDTREAARALSDALPLLQRATRVTVLTVNPADDVTSVADEREGVLTYLDGHGIKAHFDSMYGTDISAGDLILNRCSDLGADLLVAGGYGRSHVRERFMGGVTRTLFEQMTLPVLMSH